LVEFAADIQTRPQAVLELIAQSLEALSQAGIPRSSWGEWWEGRLAMTAPSGPNPCCSEGSNG
jgi:hypothetical protein